MTYEDFTTYTIVEEGAGDITVNSSTQITFDVERDDTTYIYKDKGVGFFGDYCFYVDCTENPATTSAHDSYLYVWGVTNSINNANLWTEGQAVALRNSTTGGAHIIITLHDRGTGTNDSWSSGAINTRYYLICRRIGTLATVEIYSDAAHTTLLDTLSLTCETETYRYLYAGSALDSGNNGYNFYGIVYNLEYIVTNYTFTCDSYNFTSDCFGDVQYNDSKNLKIWDFWTGQQEVTDNGLNRKNIVITGYEHTNAYTKMTNIDTVVNNGEIITLHNMMNTDLNTTWIAESFSYETIGPGSVQWSLTLEKYY